MGKAGLALAALTNFIRFCSVETVLGCLVPSSSWGGGVWCGDQSRGMLAWRVRVLCEPNEGDVCGVGFGLVGLHLKGRLAAGFFSSFFFFQINFIGVELLYNVFISAIRQNESTVLYRQASLWDLLLLQVTTQGVK